MWDGRFAETCRQHPDLVAVYESAHGRLGLLLRQTLVPLDAERVEWLTETRVVARRLVDERFFAARRTHGRAPVVAAAAPATSNAAAAPIMGFETARLEALKAWYEAMAPCWLAIQPA